MIDWATPVTMAGWFADKIALNEKTDYDGSSVKLVPFQIKPIT